MPQINSATSAAWYRDTALRLVSRLVEPPKEHVSPALPRPIVHDGPHNQVEVEKTLTQLCNTLLQKKLHSWSERPLMACQGIYVIWECPGSDGTCPREALFVGRGLIRQQLDELFQGHDRQLIGCYLASCKTQREWFYVSWCEASSDQLSQCSNSMWRRCLQNSFGYCPIFNKTLDL